MFRQHIFSVAYCLGNVFLNIVNCKGNAYLHVVSVFRKHLFNVVCLLGKKNSMLHIDRICNAFSGLHVDKIGNGLFFHNV